MKKFVLRALILVLFFSSLSLANDWPQYLGPNRNAISAETGILRSWPAEGPEVLWTVSLGSGFGGAAVSKGKVYILDRVSNEKDILRCLDLATGKEDWTFSYDAPGQIDHPGSRSVPTIEGNYVYTCGSFGHVHCINIETHQVVWTKNIWTDFGSGNVPRWAISQNPLLYGDFVILASQTPKAGVVAYNKLSGSIEWASSALPGDPGYVSPALVKISGEDHLVMIPANSGVLGMDPKTGKMLWSYEGWQCKIPVPNVTEIGGGQLFITGGYRAGSAMIKVTKDQGSYSVEEQFTTDEFGTHVHPAVLYKGFLYGHCSTNETRDGLVCMDIHGKVMWKTGRDPLFDKGGFILVDGLFLSADGNKGFLYLHEPNPNGFKELAKAKLLDPGENWAPLALTDGKLLIRDQKQMKCVSVR
ncbi:MAG: PQQ-like beta-propeller repeat protein [Candidatus Aminicenantes bacterium]|nr:PQQ-like beta-propeller repeat protein [Candidatus Aminicenantes bacterium]